MTAPVKLQTARPKSISVIFPRTALADLDEKYGEMGQNFVALVGQADRIVPDLKENSIRHGLPEDDMAAGLFENDKLAQRFEAVIRTTDVGAGETVVAEVPGTPFSLELVGVGELEVNQERNTSIDLALAG